MMRWLMIVGLSPLLAMQAHAAPTPTGSPAVAQAHVAHPRSLDLRVVEDGTLSPATVHSGMIADTDVAPNASLGVGMFKGAPRRVGSGETRPDGRTRNSRKAAVAFVLKF